MQFERVNSQGFGKRIEFVNSQKGFCVGFATLMLRTVNAGETWEYLSGEYQAGPSILTGLPCTYDITDIDFVDENRGWIVGRAGGCPQPPGHFIMSTIDGGQGWKMDMLDEYLPLYGLNAVDFNDAGQGWAIGADGLLFFQEVTVGEKVVEENSHLKLFPNPAHTYVRIISNTNFNRITLYNQYGQLLYHDEDVYSGEINLDLSQYKNDIYFIETDGKYYKIVKI
ncbi:MAG TPA: YCF48-related protein [Bacteroidales bacterium]|nr:YCF48-related protein [Bacteroidales bacterium]